MHSPASVTKDGFETQIGINAIGHFLLAKRLAPKSKRQVWLSSAAHAKHGGPRFDIEKCKNFDVNDTKNYDAWGQYQQSKIGDIMLAKEFAKRYSSMVGVSCHPGMIKTRLSRHLGITDLIPLVFSLVARGIFSFKTPEQGAATTITCATSKDVKNGGYYIDCEVANETANAKLDEENAVLFDYCDEVTKQFQ